VSSLARLLLDATRFVGHTLPTGGPRIGNQTRRLCRLLPNRDGRGHGRPAGRDVLRRSSPILGSENGGRGTSMKPAIRTETIFRSRSANWLPSRRSSLVGIVWANSSPRGALLRDPMTRDNEAPPGPGRAVEGRQRCWFRSATPSVTQQASLTRQAPGASGKHLIIPSEDGSEKRFNWWAKVSVWSATIVPRNRLAESQTLGNEGQVIQR
jgi:hypothetical protein